MGCDGGTIPTRDELVRLKKKPEQKDKTAEMNAKWKCCAITQQPLRPPIMACELGRLYNKEAVLELLLDRSQFEGNNFDHIRGLKDVHELKLTDNPGYKRDKADLGDAYIDHMMAKYICPVTGLEMSGKYRFVYLVKCGCVFAERAMKEVKADVCHKCGLTFQPDDVVVLHGTEEDLTLMQANMAQRKLQAKLEKKAKKKKAAESATVTSSSTATNGADGPSSSKKARTDGPSSGSAGAEKPSSSKMNGASKKSELKKEGRPKKAGGIQNDPNVTAAYKSLFTTCDKAKNQMKAHWVTFDPCHY